MPELVAGFARVAAQVGVRKNVEAESVGDEGIERVVVPIDRPVLAEFFRAKDEHRLVL